VVWKNYLADECRRHGVRVRMVENLTSESERGRVSVVARTGEEGYAVQCEPDNDKLWFVLLDGAKVTRCARPEQFQKQEQLQLLPEGQ
jgi:hypothetical protein